MVIGAHMPIGKGFRKVPGETVEIGGNAFQIFPHNARQWNARMPNESDAKEFISEMSKYKINFRNAMCHSAYLINLASPKEDVYEKSTSLLKTEMKICRTLNILYLNIHPGSHLGSGEKEGIDRIASSLDNALNETQGVSILLENVVKKGGNIGFNFKQLKDIIDKCSFPERVGITWR